MKGSKNNPTNKNKSKGKFVLESDCRSCTNKCKKGQNYIGLYEIKGEGNGVWCER